MIRVFGILIIILLIYPGKTDAQRWKRSRYEVVYGLGISNFLGDLGGANREGSHFIRDMELRTTRPSLYLGARYKVMERLAVKFNLIYGMVSGNDNFSESARTNRNLHFRSTIYEFSTQYEYSIIKEKLSSRYTFSNFRGFADLSINTFVFLGVGGFYFNPKAEYQGKWWALQPLGTEGQGLPGEGNKYSRIQLAVPFGIGFKYGINRKYSFAIEIGMRYTTTDYLDDVSTDYYDNDAILAAYGEEAAYFADPREGDPVSDGTLYRGDPKHKDIYMFLFFQIVYKLRTTRNGFPKF